MATIPSIPRLNPGGPVAALGQFRQVIDGVGATRTLAPEESGALCLFDSAAGVVYTLPAPQVGMQFEFLTKATITSNSAKVLTDAATTFLIGGAALVNSGAATGQFFAGNGTTHRSTNGNGTTTCVEGNTSPDKKGNQRNGGECCLKVRAYKKKNGSKLVKSQPVAVVGFGKPKFKETK